MMHKVWCNIQEVPYCFPRSSIKFQGHTGWKIDDLDQIWARLLGRSQLSNPSDLPCFTECDTGSWIWQQDSNEHIRYFELLIDALSEILIEMWQFKKMTYLCPGDVTDDVMSTWNITCTTMHPQPVPAKYCLCGTSYSSLNRPHDSVTNTLMLPK